MKLNIINKLLFIRLLNIIYFYLSLNTKKSIYIGKTKKELFNKKSTINDNNNNKTNFEYFFCFCAMGKKKIFIQDN